MSRPRERRRKIQVGWTDNIERATRRNYFWRRVLFTGRHLQVVLMSVPPGEELGWEVHSNTDQFFRVDASSGVRGRIEMGAMKNEEIYEAEVVDLSDGMAAVVPAGTWHNVINTSRTYPLTFYTIYSPPHHPRRRLDITKKDEITRERREKRRRK